MDVDKKWSGGIITGGRPYTCMGMISPQNHAQKVYVWEVSHRVGAYVS